jgi:hypothetical protein
MLTFEDDHAGSMPSGWMGGPPSTIFVDTGVTRSGKAAGRLERDTESPQSFSTITGFLPVSFSRRMIELRGWLRTEQVSDFAGLWMRQDGDTPNLAFDNMESRGLKGTTGWTEYSIMLPIHAQARQLFFGVLMAGTGKTWAHDLQLLVDGKPVWEAPPRPEPETVVTRDHEFDGGPKIALKELTSAQVGNLALLGKVWGPS